jgi:pyrophosphate--fructose-6-phosphate 1-phosphotransferase
MIADIYRWNTAPLSYFGPDPNSRIQTPAPGSVSDTAPLLVPTQGNTPSVGPKRWGIVFSGGPAPGGHDVLVGICQHLRPGDALVGFCGGFGGLLAGHAKPIDPSVAPMLAGTAGFDYLGTDRTKIATPQHMNTVQERLVALGLDGLLVVGGDDSNTNAIHLSRALGTIQVIGIPKTIDGDLQFPPYLTTSFGFHTAIHHYAERVLELAIDAKATQKYLHMVKLMGRNASHVTLAVAQQVQPHMCLLSEEITDLGWGFADVIAYFWDGIQRRMAANKPYGMCLFPEGIADAIPELRAYLNGDTTPLAAYFEARDYPFYAVAAPTGTDDHGNQSLSLLPVESIFAAAIDAESHHHACATMVCIPHFFGYEGRSSVPTEFDQQYAQLLGKTAYGLALSGHTGVLASVDRVTPGCRPCGIPLAAMLGCTAANRWVIQKRLVETTDTAYNQYRAQKNEWLMTDPEFPRPVLWTEPPIP